MAEDEPEPTGPTAEKWNPPVVTDGAADRERAAEAVRYCRSLVPAARCGKCNALVPLRYVHGGRCPDCLAAEVDANRETLTAEFERLLEVERKYQALLANPGLDGTP